MISVYSSTEKSFATNGIKILHPLKAKVYKEDNGEYYIELKDVLSNLEYYAEGLIIRTDTPWGKQCFRLTNPEINKDRITSKGYHLFFDTKRYVIEDSYVVDKQCNDALDHLNNACDVETPFSFISDLTTSNSYRCVRKTLYEAISTVLDRWGGHLVRNNFNIEVRQSIGEDRGVVLSYAKNITGIKVIENWDDVVTKILPVGKDGFLLPETYIEVEEELYDIPYTKVVSFTQDDINEEDYTDEEGNLDEEAYNSALETDLREQAEEYLEEYKLPQINYTVEASIQNVSDVGDTIHVKHPKCKIDLTTNVIAIEYDCIAKKYTKIEFGNFKNKLEDLISNVTNKVTSEVAVKTSETYAKLQQELETATNKIWNAMGNSYVIYDGSKILIVDTLPAEEATNCILINNGGIGFSTTGINGTFNSAWTIDGELDMQNINVINLVADMIKGGTLKLGGENNVNGIVEIYDGDSNIIGKITKDGLIFVFGDDEANIVDQLENLSDQSETIASINANIEEIKASIESIQDVTTSDSNIGTATLENVLESEIIHLEVTPTSEDLSYLYPSNSLYPDKIYPTTRNIIFTEITSGDEISYTLPCDLLYIEEDIKDTFYLDYDTEKCYVIRKVGVDDDGNKYALDSATSEYFDYPTLILPDGSYTVAMESFATAKIYVRALASNIYTNQYATKVELSSAITIVESEINESVEKQITDINGSVSALEGELELQATEVALKLNSSAFTASAIIGLINNGDGTSSALISADMIDLLSNGTLNLTAKDITIEADNLSIDASGNCVANSFSSSNATITGGSMTLFSESSTDDRLKLINGADTDNYVSWSPQTLLWYGVSGGLIQIRNQLTAPIIGLSSSDGSSTTNLNSIYCESPEFRTTSLASTKKNFEKFENALDIIDEIDLYKYNLQAEDDTHKKHIGFVIGDGYNYSSEITGVDDDGNETGVDLYSMISLCLQAIKEQKIIISELTERISSLEGKE